MAMHNDINNLVYDTIEEYLQAARVCITSNKSDSGCYGMAALVLLASAIDAMGTYYRSGGTYSFLPNTSSDWKKELGAVINHYQNIYNAYFVNKQAFKDLNEFKTIFYEEYRCHAVHNAMITQSNVLSVAGDTGKPVITDSNGIRYLYIDRLYHVVNVVFQEFKNDHPINNKNSTGSDTGSTQSSVS